MFISEFVYDKSEHLEFVVVEYFVFFQKGDQAFDIVKRGGGVDTCNFIDDVVIVVAGVVRNLREAWRVGEETFFAVNIAFLDKINGHVEVIAASDWKYVVNSN